MKAKLVTISLMTRIVVEDNATEEQILEATKCKFIEKVQTEIGEHVEDISDDVEMPYGEGLNEPYVSTNVLGNPTDLTKYYNITPEPINGVPLIEQECLVEVKVIDKDGNEHIGIIFHNGEEDCWDGLTIEKGDLGFDLNTFGGLSYGTSPNAFSLNAYQCTVKRDGCWCMDDNIELVCSIVKITPKN